MSGDFWKSLRDENGEAEACSLSEIQHLDFSTMPTDVYLWLMDNDFEPVVGHRFTFRTEPTRGFDGIVGRGDLACGVHAAPQGF